MDSSSTHRLTVLQQEVLAAFFEREQAFFLTGGAALAGFHLGHRASQDLDLFTADAEAFLRARHVLRDAARQVGASMETLRDAPGFQRHFLRRGDDAVLVDLVLEPAAGSSSDRERHAMILVDSAPEIFANKLTALLGRAEERDIVDVMSLEAAGLPLHAALARALEKDGGCTPGQLAFLLAEIYIPDGVALPAGVQPSDLRAYLLDLVRRLRIAAFPG